MKSLLLVTFLSVCHFGFSYDLKGNFPNFDRPSETNSILKLPKLDVMKSDFGKSRKLRFLPSAGKDEYGAGVTSAAFSLAVPGLGLYMATKQPLSLILAPICYGLAGVGIFKMSKGASEANTHYDNYLNEKNPELFQTHLDAVDAGLEKNASGIKYLGGSIIIWVAQTVWTGIYGYYNDKYRRRNAKWKNTVSGLNVGYDNMTGMTTLNMTIKI